MRLNQLYHQTDKEVFLEYSKRLKGLVDKTPSRIINEAKITITIDDDNKVKGIPEESRVKFLDGAKRLGKFEDTEWVNQLIRGMKQAGVQGFNEITEDESPVSRAEIRQLIGLLMDLLGSN